MKNNMNVNRNKIEKNGAGFTLIELTVGMAIFIVLLLSVSMMMMNVFRSDSQAKSYEEVQAATLQIVNEFIHEARFSVDASVDPDFSGPELDKLIVEYMDDSVFPAVKQELEYSVNAEGVLEKYDSKDASIKNMTNSRLIVEKFDIVDVADDNGKDIPLLLVKLKLVDVLGEMESLDEKVIMLSVRR